MIPGQETIGLITTPEKRLARFYANKKDLEEFEERQLVKLWIKSQDYKNYRVHYELAISHANTLHACASKARMEFKDKPKLER